MLDIRRNRIDYTGSLLAPPDGFHFERAVATTYSLDLDTLLAVLLPLAIDGDVPDDPEAFADGPLILRALWRVSKRLTIFHQSGQIPEPRRSTPLYTLLDRILVPVALPADDGKFPAFHPKTWAIEYRDNAGESRFRFIVLSRNLTRDDSFDVALALESGTDRRRIRRTRPLLDFLGHLGSCIPGDLPHASDHAKRLSELSRGFATHPLTLVDSDIWTDFALLPLYDGVTREAFSSSLFAAGNQGRFAAMSPFLSDQVVRRLVKSSEETPILFTRPDSYANLSPSVQESIEAWALKDVIASPALPEDDAAARRDTDLHAKIYLRESDEETAAILGSVNATESGLNRNIEFAVQLFCSTEDYGIDKFKEDVFGKNPDAPSNPFEQLLPDSTAKPTDENMQADNEAAQATIAAFCRCGASGRIEADGALHAIVVNVPEAFSFPSRVQNCSLRPQAIRADCAQPAKGLLKFTGLKLAELSPMFVLSVETSTDIISRVVRIPLDGLDEAARDVAVTQAVVEASGGWMACMGVFFSPEPYHAAATANERIGKEPPGSAVARHAPIGLYEDMLRTAAEPGGAARFAEMDIDAMLAGQTGPDASRVRELLSLFRQALPGKRSMK